LLFDLLTREEEQEDRFSGHLRFDIPMLSDRLIRVTESMFGNRGDFALGYFGASTGAAAALNAAAFFGSKVRAVVSRGGRPDLAAANLPKVMAPTLLIVGSRDEAVIKMNREAYALLKCEKELVLIPGATHLFEEEGTLEEAACVARDWFRATLKGESSANPSWGPLGGAYRGTSKD
jgi:pimeloyl-ACP methyl ester carboxylesterase